MIINISKKVLLDTNFGLRFLGLYLTSLRGRRLKGKGKGVLGKGVLGARETQGAREEGGRETPARKPLFFLLLTSTRRMLKS